MLAASPKEEAQSYNEMLETSMFVNSQIVLWYSKSA